MTLFFCEERPVAGRNAPGVELYNIRTLLYASVIPVDEYSLHDDLFGTRSRKKCASIIIIYVRRYYHNYCLYYTAVCALCIQ